MILNASRILLKTATAREIQLCLQKSKHPIGQLPIDAANDWPTKEFLESAKYVLDGLSSSHEKFDHQESPWWLWWIVFKSGNADQLAGNLVGYVGFKGEPSKTGEVEITYSIAESARRNHLASEAIDCITKWAFQQKEVMKIVADTAKNNFASQKTLIKAGFELIGQSECEGHELIFELRKKPS